MQKFVIRVFTCQNMAIFRNPSKFLNFFEFSKKIWSRFFQECSRSPKKQFLQKSHYKCDLEELLKMTKIFVEFFDFGPKYQIFWSKIFSTYSTSQDLPLCKKSAPYFENLIFFINFYRFWSKIANFGWPPTTSYHLSWPPYEPDLSQKSVIGSEKDS